MSLIDVVNLSFTYPGSYDPVFEQVSFRMDTRWKLGFVGRNGRGKTTFLKLLLGEHDFEGRVIGGVKFDYFPFTVTNKDADTATVIQGICPHAQGWEIVCELSLLELSEEMLARPFDSLSQGEQTKVLLAALFLKENHFLLIDEPTNHLDAHGREVVSRYLQAKEGFILVSHDRFFLDSTVDHILSINKETIDIQRGNFTSWLENKNRQDRFEEAEQARLSKEVKHLREAAKRSAMWSDQVEQTKYGTKNSGLRPDRGYIGHKSAKMMRRAKGQETRQQTAIEETAKLLKNVERSDPLKLIQLPYHSDRLISVRNLSIFYGTRAICEGIHVEVKKGERIALQGKNGTGKSSLLKLICGEHLCYTGQLDRGSGLVISYVSQDTSGLQGSLRDFAQEHGIDETQLKTILRKLDFSRIQLEKEMESFSGGQKKKVLLASSLCQRAHLHIWDEPLNFVDVISRMQIQTLLMEAKPTLLFVEHDRAFCQEIATKTVIL